MSQQAIKKKRFNARFPPARIKKIMQLDEEVGKVAAAVPVLISRALENFVESFLKKAAEVTTTRQSRTLIPLHVKQCIHADRRFAFLKDIVANVSDIQSEEEGGPSQPSTPLTPHFPVPNPFQMVKGLSVDTSNIPKSKRTRRLSAVKSKIVPPPRLQVDSDEEDLTPDNDSDEDDDDTDSSQGSRKRLKLGRSVSVESAKRPSYQPHLPPSYCSVIRGPMSPLTHPYSFLGPQEPAAAHKEPQPAHLQPRVPPLPLLNLKAPLPAHMSSTTNLTDHTVFPQSAVKVDIDGVQPFHIEVSLPGQNSVSIMPRPGVIAARNSLSMNDRNAALGVTNLAPQGQNNGVKVNGSSSVAIKKPVGDVDDDYDA